MRKNDIVMIEHQLEVKVRKYEVDIISLQNLLKKHKVKSGLSNKKIAELLHIPLTQVEHYFRTDKYFAIPDPMIWYKLKRCLQIEDNSFDESIMTFITQPGAYEKANRFYCQSGISPTLLCGDEIKVIKVEKE